MKIYTTLRVNWLLGRVIYKQSLDTAIQIKTSLVQQYAVADEHCDC